MQGNRKLRRKHPGQTEYLVEEQTLDLVEPKVEHGRRDRAAGRIPQQAQCRAYEDAKELIDQEVQGSD